MRIGKVTTANVPVGQTTTTPVGKSEDEVSAPAPITAFLAQSHLLFDEKLRTLCNISRELHPQADETIHFSGTTG